MTSGVIMGSVGRCGQLSPRPQGCEGKRYVYIDICDTSSTGSNSDMLLLAVSKNHHVTYIQKKNRSTIVQRPRKI